MKGQFLERPALVPVGRHVLEALSHRGRLRPLLIVPPTDGGGMDHVLAAELAWAAAHADHPELRFNFSGFGASQGKRGGLNERCEDAEASLRLLQQNAARADAAVAAIGDAASVAVSLAARQPCLGGLGLIAPQGLAWAEISRVGVPLLVVIPEGTPARGAITKAVEEAQGTLVVVEGADPQFFRGLPEAGRAVVRWLEVLG